MSRFPKVKHSPDGETAAIMVDRAANDIFRRMFDCVKARPGDDVKSLRRDLDHCIGVTMAVDAGLKG